MRWSPYFIGPWIARVPADHAWRTITGADEMKRNGWDECGEMVEMVKLVVGENGRNPVKNLPRPRFVHHETHMEGPRREFGTPAVGGERLTHGCANHDTEGKRFKFRHPLLWRNEASLLDQWRTMYFPLALFAYIVCCRRTEQCFSVLRTHKSDIVDGSSGRRYVTDQWHNVPLLRARGLTDCTTEPFWK